MLPEGRHLWVLDHGEGVGRERSIRFVQLADGNVVQRGSIPNPFYAGFVSASPGRGEIVSAGALLDAQQDIVVSLLLRTRPECNKAGT